MAPRLRYAHQQFLQAVECLATGEGRLRERMAIVWPAIRTIVPEDFEGASDLQGRHKLLLDLLAGSGGFPLADAHADSAAIAGRLALAPAGDLAAAADYIFAIFLTLHRLSHDARE